MTTNLAFNYFNTDCHIKIYDEFAMEDEEMLEDILKKYHNTFNVFDRGSEISKFNNKELMFLASDFFYEEVKHVYSYFKRFKQFNPGVETLAYYYRSTNKWTYQSIYKLKEIMKTHIHFHENNLIEKPDPLYKINMHSSLKGRVCDVVAHFLYEKGYRVFLLDFGGNILVEGLKPSKDPWRVGIKHPNLDINIPIYIVDVYDKSVVTTGNYERPLIVNKITYGHIIDSNSGYFHNNNFGSVTVVSKSSMEADIFSTVFFQLKHAEIIKISKIAQVTTIIVDKNNNVKVIGESNGQ